MELRFRSPLTKGICWVQLSHTGSGVRAVFDDPNLMSCGGLAPVVALAGLAGLAASTLTLSARAGSTRI
jgi:hypothetical protein